MVPNDFFETKKNKIAYYLNLYGANCVVNSNLDGSLLIDNFEIMNGFCNLNDNELLINEYHKIMENIPDDKLFKDEGVIFYSFPFMFNETLFQMGKYNNIDLACRGKKYQ